MKNIEKSCLTSIIFSNKERKEKSVGTNLALISETFVIKPFLEANRAEAKGMLLAEFNEAKQMELFRKEGREEGREEGMTLLSMLMGILLENGLVEEAKRATKDEKYRKELMVKYNLF